MSGKFPRGTYVELQEHILSLKAELEQTRKERDDALAMLTFEDEDEVLITRLNDLGTLHELESKLAAATGPSHELNIRLAWLRFGKDAFSQTAIAPTTSSLDAAVSFTEGMNMPNWQVNGGSPGATVLCGHNEDYGEASAPTPALALCLATVRALIAKETK